MPAVHPRSYCVVSLDRIAQNYRAIHQAVGSDVSLACIVKSEAYGHGMLAVARRLETCGATWLAVSSVQEGVALREGGVRAEVLVLGGVFADEWREALASDLTPVVHSLEELPVLEEAALRLQRKTRFHLKLDTGMGRLGTRATAPEIAHALAPLQAATLDGLMTHFASPGNFRTHQTDEQLGVFENMTAQLAALGIRPAHLHMASSNATAYDSPHAWKRMVRPGISLYGYISPAEGDAPVPRFAVEPALTWRARAITVKEIEAGATVGYGATFIAPHRMRIAVLAAGYADGVQPRLANRGHVIAHGRLAPIIGAVSMNLTTIDVTGVPELQPGDDVTLLGREGDTSIDAQQIAMAAGGIAYHVLCAIKPHIPRIYE